MESAYYQGDSGGHLSSYFIPAVIEFFHLILYFCNTRRLLFQVLSNFLGSKIKGPKRSLLSFHLLLHVLKKKTQKSEELAGNRKAAQARECRPGSLSLGSVTENTKE